MSVKVIFLSCRCNQNIYKKSMVYIKKNNILQQIFMLLDCKDYFWNDFLKTMCDNSWENAVPTISTSKFQCVISILL